MKTFEEKYLTKIRNLFEKYKGKMGDQELNCILDRGFVSSLPNMNAEILICGINPSDDGNPPHVFEFAKTTGNKYFKPLHQITDGCIDRNKIDYIDLFCFRRRTQKDIWRFTNDPVGIKFISEHLIITQQIIEEIRPKLILVFNRAAATFFGKNFNSEAKRSEDRNIWMGYKFTETENAAVCCINGLLEDRINPNAETTNIVGTHVFFSTYMRFLNKGKRTTIKQVVSDLINMTFQNLNYKEEPFYPMIGIEQTLMEIAQQVMDNFNFGKHLNIGEIIKNSVKLNTLFSIFDDPNKEIDLNKELSGLYVFAEFNGEEWKYLYAGISRRTIQRIKEHIMKGDKFTATWAYLMVRKNGDKELQERIELLRHQKTTDANREAKKKLAADVKDAIQKIQNDEFPNYDVTIIPITDNFLLHIAEVFVACELNCYWNSFETH